MLQEKLTKLKKNTIILCTVHYKGIHEPGDEGFDLL